jgi:hypothetical protein
VNLIWHGFERVLQGLPGRLSVSCFHELSDGEFGRPIDADEEIEPSVSGMHLVNLDGKKPMG